MTFTLRKVDPFHDEDAEQDIRFLDKQCFLPQDAALDLGLGSHWWLVTNGKGQPCAYASMRPARGMKGFAYLSRAGVAPKFRGNGLQSRLIAARVRRAKLAEYVGLITDTSYDNIRSSNNLIEAGFKLFRPTEPWSFKAALYWHKVF